MKMKKLLSIGALALTLTTFTSISAFAAETAGNKTRNEAAKEIAMKAYKGDQVVNRLGISAKTPVKSYAKQPLIDKVITKVNEQITDEKVKELVRDTIQNEYNKGKGFKDIFNEIVEINNREDVDITTDNTFDAVENVMRETLKEFEKAYDDGVLESKINEYFNAKALNGELIFGKNSNNRLVISLVRNEKIILQVSSENVYSVEDEVENKIGSWSDLKNYYNKIK